MSHVTWRVVKRVHVVPLFFSFLFPVLLEQQERFVHNLEKVKDTQ